MKPAHVVALLVALASVPTLADEVLYQYECDTFPEEAGWEIFDPCEDPCTRYLDAQNGYYVLEWPTLTDLVNHDYLIAQDPTPPPPTLWVEWQFRSNLPVETNFWSCDGNFNVHYGGMHETINMYGDTAISFGGDYVVTGLDIDEFHTYRYESLDGITFTFAVDGNVFITGSEYQPNGYHYLQFRGHGGCQTNDPVVNEWDFIRYGTISEGEQIVSTDPPQGRVDPAGHPTFDRFEVTFDQPGYVYIDEITVSFTGPGTRPKIAATRRTATGGTNTLEVVLEQPMIEGQAAAFTFDTVAGDNVVVYGYGRDPRLPLVPTVSAWGLATLALLLLSAATILVRPRTCRVKAGVSR